jgi:hypothetical protein
MPASTAAALPRTFVLIPGAGGAATWQWQMSCPAGTSWHCPSQKASRGTCSQPHNLIRRG